MPTTLSLSTARSDPLTNLNRREWLSIGASGLLPSAAAGKPGHDPIRLSLNENPFGPSPLALQAIKAQLTDLSSYAGDEVAELTKTIAAREDIAAEQIVLGEILDVLGLYLSARGGPGGEFIYSEPGYTATPSRRPAALSSASLSTSSLKTTFLPLPARSMRTRARSTSSIRIIRAAR